MWEEPPANRRCSSPAKAESPSLFPSLRLPSFFTYEEEKMTITSRQSFNILTVIFLLLSTAGMSNLSWLSKVAILLTVEAEAERDHTHVIYVLLTAYALKWESNWAMKVQRQSTLTQKVQRENVSQHIFLSGGRYVMQRGNICPLKPLKMTKMAMKNLEQSLEQSVMINVNDVKHF